MIIDRGTFTLSCALVLLVSCSSDEGTKENPEQVSAGDAAEEAGESGAAGKSGAGGDASGGSDGEAGDGGEGGEGGSDSVQTAAGRGGAGADADSPAGGAGGAGGKGAAGAASGPKAGAGAEGGAGGAASGPKAGSGGASGGGAGGAVAGAGGAGASDGGAGGAAGSVAGAGGAGAGGAGASGGGAGGAAGSGDGIPPRTPIGLLFTDEQAEQLCALARAGFDGGDLSTLHRGMCAVTGQMAASSGEVDCAMAQAICVTRLNNMTGVSGFECTLDDLPACPLLTAEQFVSCARARLQAEFSHYISLTCDSNLELRPPLQTPQACLDLAEICEELATPAD